MCLHQSSTRTLSNGSTQAHVLIHSVSWIKCGFVRDTGSERVYVPINVYLNNRKCCSCNLNYNSRSTLENVLSWSKLKHLNRTVHTCLLESLVFLSIWPWSLWCILCFLRLQFYQCSSNYLFAMKLFFQAHRLRQKCLLSKNRSTIHLLKIDFCSPTAQLSLVPANVINWSGMMWTHTYWNYYTKTCSYFKKLGFTLKEQHLSKISSFSCFYLFPPMVYCVDVHEILLIYLWWKLWICYRRQRRCGKVMFSLLSVCSWGGSPCDHYPWCIRPHCTAPTFGDRIVVFQPL